MEVKGTNTTMLTNLSFYCYNGCNYLHLLTTIYHSVITIIGTKTESYRLFLSGYSSSVLVTVALAFAKPFMDCIMPDGSG